MDNSIYQELNVPESIYGQLDGQLQTDFDIWLTAVIAYYNTDEGEEPIMSDSEFDQLNEALLLVDNIGDWIKSVIYRNGRFETKHSDYTQEMISLFKVKWKSKAQITDISKFFQLSNNKLSDLLRQGNIWYARKYDGCSLKITYDSNYNIQSIITRGGLDVTKQFKNQKDIADCSQLKHHIICGELVIRKSIFNAKYSSAVGGDYENPRNFVGGIVKRKNIPQEILDDLLFIPCTDGIDSIINVSLKHTANDGSDEDIWKPLKESDLFTLEEKIHYYRNEDILCDGIVLSVFAPNHERQVKDNYPLNMVAVKFPAPRALTKIIGFDWTQKKSGKLTPRLMVKPVQLDGSTISFTNGYNIDQVISKGIGIGSVVEIEKSGDIIPVIVKVLNRSKEIVYPTVPYKHIGKHLIAIDNEASKQFKFIAALRLLQIQGIGDTIAEQIGKVLDYNILEIFNQAHKPQLSAAIGGGAVWIKFCEIYNKKTLYLNELINLLQFDNVGPKISLKIAKLLMKMSTDTSNISSDVLTNVCRGEGVKRIKEAMQTLASYGIRTLKPVDISEDTITFEMSGNPPKIGDKTITKQQFVDKIKEQYPNSVHTSLTKETKYLIVDSTSSNTSKVIKARKYNIPIVTYTDVLTGKITL